MIGPMILRKWMMWGALSLATACGSTDEPGPGPGDDDTTAPVLVTATPAAGTAKVGILAKLTFSFDEALDPATVTEGSVRVSTILIGHPTPVKGRVEYDDASHTITFTPVRPLQYGTRYAVRIGASVADLAGNTFAGTELAFVSTVNSTSKAINYSTVSGVQSGWTEYTLDASGYLRKSVNYNGMGMDATWFTSDDLAGGRYDITFTPDGLVSETRGYAIGTDGRWNTADDVIRTLSKLTYEPSGRQLENARVDEPGLDGQWGTVDDPITLLVRYTYDGAMVRLVQYTGPGDDGMWRTADDAAGDMYVYRFDANELFVRQETWNAGPDLRPGTVDDAASGSTEYEYDANYAQTAAIQRTAGNDNTWFTADDGYAYIGKDVYDAKGASVGFFQYVGPGTDGVWRTADDVMNYRTANTSDANGLATSSTAFSGAGQDGVWNTADDAISGYTTTAYDAAGNRVDYNSYQRGPDTVWHTPDDIVSYHADFDLAH